MDGVSLIYEITIDQGLLTFYRRRRIWNVGEVRPPLRLKILRQRRLRHRRRRRVEDGPGRPGRRRRHQGHDGGARCDVGLRSTYGNETNVLLYFLTAFSTIERLRQLCTNCVRVFYVLLHLRAGRPGVNKDLILVGNTDCINFKCFKYRTFFTMTVYLF